MTDNKFKSGEFWVSKFDSRSKVRVICDASFAGAPCIVYATPEHYAELFTGRGTRFVSLRTTFEQQFIHLKPDAAVG